MFIIEVPRDLELQPSRRYEKMNHYNPYLIKMFGFMGVTDITFIDVENNKYRRQKLTALIDITMKLKRTLYFKTINLFN